MCTVIVLKKSRVFERSRGFVNFEYYFPKALETRFKGSSFPEHPLLPRSGHEMAHSISGKFGLETPWQISNG